MTTNLTSNQRFAIWLSALIVAAIAFVFAARWFSLEADRAAATQEALQRTQSEVEVSRAKLEETMTTAQAKAQELNDAVKNSEQYQENQRVQAGRAVGLANGLMAAANMKTAMTEFYLTEGKWPSGNQEIGMPAAASFNAQGLKSVGIVPGGRIKLIVEDRGKPAEVYWNANVNEMGQVRWDCMTPSIPDIARLAPACKYLAR